MHRLYNESREGPRSEDQGTRRDIKELHYRYEVKKRIDGRIEVKVASVAI